MNFFYYENFWMNVLCLLERAIGGARCSCGSRCLAYLLQVFANTKFVAQGKRVHHHMLQNRFEDNLLLAGKLAAMYDMCQSDSIECASRISILKPLTNRSPLPSQSLKLNEGILSLHRFLRYPVIPQRRKSADWSRLGLHRFAL
jgi:hypothetical protein